MNEETLDEGERLLAAASPGPWGAGYWDGQHHVENDEVAVTGDLPRVPDAAQAGANAEAIVWAVNTAPALIVAARLGLERKTLAEDIARCNDVVALKAEIQRLKAKGKIICWNCGRALLRQAIRCQECP